MPDMHWLGRHRLLILAAICLFWTGLALVLHGVWSEKSASKIISSAKGARHQSTQMPPFEWLDAEYLRHLETYERGF